MIYYNTDGKIKRGDVMRHQKYFTFKKKTIKDHDK